MRWQIFVKEQTGVMVEIDDEAIGIYILIYILYIFRYIVSYCILDYVYGLGKDNNLVMEEVDQPYVTSVASQESPQANKGRGKGNGGAKKKRKLTEVEAEEVSGEEEEIIFPDDDEGIGQGGEIVLESEAEKSDSSADEDFQPLTQAK